MANDTRSAIGLTFGRKVCEILGIDPKQTVSIDIHIAPNKLLVATVTRTLDDGELKQLERAFEGVTYGE